MTYSDKLRFNALRKQIGLLESSVKILRDDNERKTKELARVKSLFCAVYRTL